MTTTRIELTKFYGQWCLGAYKKPFLCVRGLACRFNIPSKLDRLTCYLSATHVHDATQITVAFRKGSARLTMFNHQRSGQFIMNRFYNKVMSVSRDGTAWIWFEYEEPDHE